MRVVKLKNGAEESEVLVARVLICLNKLIDEKSMVLYGLVMKCRDANYDLFGNAGEVLQGLSLLNPDNTPHDSVRNIVLSAVTGEGMEMVLGSPVAQVETMPASYTRTF